MRSTSPHVRTETARGKASLARSSAFRQAQSAHSRSGSSGISESRRSRAGRTSGKRRAPFSDDLDVAPSPRGQRLTSEPQAPGQQIAKHDPIAQQAVEWIGERRRAVLLEEEVADPGEAVACQWRSREPPHIARENRGDDRRDHQRRADEVQSPAHRMAMLCQIERIEFLERLEAIGHERERAAAAYASGLSCGNRITSRIDGLSVNNMTSRSMPTPSPAAGGIPYSSARM